MAKYINADEIDYKIIYYPQSNLYTGTVLVKPLDGVYALKEDIDAMPAADVQEVKHGHWIIRYEGTYKRAKCYCSVCGKPNGVAGKNQMRPYCPWCGAKNLEDKDVEVP